MTTGKIDIKTPKRLKNDYLWKYIDLHRLIDFIYSEELHFTRLDKFDDPIDGIKASNLRIREENKKNQIKTEQSENELKLLDYIDFSNQKRQFVNCWFYDNRESMAMWEIYSSIDSVVLKVDINSLINELNRCSIKFIKDNGNRLSVIGDLVSYYPLNPFEQTNKINGLKYAAMIKDLSYEYEKEYRLLIYVMKEWLYDEEINNFRFPVILNNLKFELVCHPLMEDWKFKNIEKLAKIKKIKVIKSKIKLRK